MSFQGKFNKRLDRLFRKRTGWLRRALTTSPGPVPVLLKASRERNIRRLQKIAHAALARKLAKTHFDDSVAKRKTWTPNGSRSVAAKGQNFRAWARENIDQANGKVYVFYHKRRCKYVGRTKGRGSRPSRHFKKEWFKGTTRIMVYMAPRKSEIPRLECLAVHRFRPTENKARAARQKWSPECPLCTLDRKIKSEIRSIFRFR